MRKRVRSILLSIFFKLIKISNRVFHSSDDNMCASRAVVRWWVLWLSTADCSAVIVVTLNTRPSRHCCFYAHKKLLENLLFFNYIWSITLTQRENRNRSERFRSTWSSLELFLQFNESSQWIELYMNPILDKRGERRGEHTNEQVNSDKVFFQHRVQLTQRKTDICDVGGLQTSHHFSMISFSIQNEKNIDFFDTLIKD